MRRIFLFLLCLPLSLSALPVKIQGFTSLPGQLVRVIVAKDYISGTDSLITSTKTDFKGSFELIFHLETTEVSQIAIGLHRCQLLLRPGATYELSFLLNQGASSVAYFDPQPLEVSVKSATDQGMQEQFGKLNFIYNTFVVQRFAIAQRFGRIDLFDSLRLAMQAGVPAGNDSFLESYRFYKLASIAAPIKKMTPQQVFSSYFKNKPELLRNPEYMAMLDQYFGDYFLSTSKKTNFDGFVLASTQGFQSLMNYLSDDSLFEGEPALRELVMLIHLDRLFHHPAFAKGATRRIISEIATSSRYPEHRRIAENIIASREQLTFGSTAPPIRLLNAAGNNVLPDKLSEKLLVLVFVKENCEVCIRLLDQLLPIYEKYGDQVKMLVVSTKTGFAAVKGEVAKRISGFEVAHTGDDILAYERYNIKVFPEIVLLFPDRRIAMSPAPSENIDFHIGRFLR